MYTFRCFTITHVTHKKNIFVLISLQFDKLLLNNTNFIDSNTNPTIANTLCLFYKH